MPGTGYPGLGLLGEHLGTVGAGGLAGTMGAGGELMGAGRQRAPMGALVVWAPHGCWGAMRMP